MAFANQEHLVLKCNYFGTRPQCTLLAPKFLHKLLYANALGNGGFENDCLCKISWGVGWGGAKRVYYGVFESRESSFPKYSEISIKRTPKRCKNCAMFVNDQHSTVSLYCDKVACC